MTLIIFAIPAFMLLMVIGAVSCRLLPDEGEIGYTMRDTATSLNLLYQFWIHTERIGKLWAGVELVLNTPSHHRVHHAVTRSTWTRTTPACSSSGTGCSARSNPRSSSRCTGSPRTSTPTTHCGWRSTSTRRSGPTTRRRAAAPAPPPHPGRPAPAGATLCPGSRAPP